MPPTDTSLESRYRYANRLLAALTLQAGGELRIPTRYIRMIEAEPRQGLSEDSNFDTEELVLRLLTKNAAVYPVESELCASPKPQSVTTSPTPVQVSRPEVPQSVRQPLTEEKLVEMQRKINANLTRVRLKKERLQNETEQERLSRELGVSLQGSER